MSEQYEMSGRHYLATIYGCSPALIGDPSYVKRIILAALSNINCTILACSDHRFPNGGYTCVYLLAESHCSLHTYPEHRALFVDLFTCGEMAGHGDFEKVVMEALGAVGVRSQFLERGLPTT